MAERLRPRRWSRLALRVRLTLATAVATAVVLTGTGVLIYTQFARDLDQRIDADLVSRAQTVDDLSRAVPLGRLLDAASERFGQRYRRGRLVDTPRALRQVALLDPDQVAAASHRRHLLSRAAFPAAPDGARVVAFPVGRTDVVAIAEPLANREAELHRLASLLAISFPAALLLSSLIGYLVAGGALRPVEAIRRRAAEIGGSDQDDRLPVPGTGDELDRLAATLNELLTRQQSAVQRERRLVADASHELRTPISVLLTRLDVALQGDLDPGAREVIAAAREDTRRLSRLAADLLVLARADQGRLPLRLEPVDAQDLLDDVRSRHTPAIERAGRRLDVSLDPPDGVVLLADPDRMAQMLDNLVVNALRYGGGAITVSVGDAAAGEATCAVADQGPGFSETYLAKPFVRFGAEHIGGSQEGTGLGLAIVAALARAQGGRAFAGNEPAGGARVAFTVPLA